MVNNRQQIMSWQTAKIFLNGLRKHFRVFQSVTAPAKQRLSQPLPLSVSARNDKHVKITATPGMTLV
jgi:hypothetical protein